MPLSIEQQFLQRLFVFAVAHIFYIFVGLGSIRYHIAILSISEHAILAFWKQLKFPFDLLYVPRNPEASLKDFTESKLTQGLSLSVGFSVFPLLYICISIYRVIRFGILDHRFNYLDISLDILWVFLYITATSYFLLLGRGLIRTERNLSFVSRSVSISSE
jgi:hypothetical protein